MKRITEDEKLGAVERLVEKWRPHRSQPNSDEGIEYLALKAVAADLRARRDEKIQDGTRKLQEAIDRVEASRVQPGYDYGIGQLRALAELTIGLWPLIRQSLQAYAETYPEDR